MQSYLLHAGCPVSPFTQLGPEHGPSNILFFPFVRWAAHPGCFQKMNCDLASRTMPAHAGCAGPA